MGIAAALSLSGCNARPAQEIRPPKVESMAEQGENALWKLQYVKSSCRHNGSFYSVIMGDENALLTIAEPGKEALFYDLGKPEGSPVIAVDDRNAYIIYDGGRTVKRLELSSKTLGTIELPKALKNPAAASNGKTLYILSEGTGPLTMIDVATGALREIDMLPFLEREGLERMESPTLEQVSNGIMFTAKGFGKVYIIENGKDGEVRAFSDSMRDVVRYSGKLESPRLMSLGRDIMCILPSPNGSISCYSPGGKVEKIIKRE